LLPRRFLPFRCGRGSASVLSLPPPSILFGSGCIPQSRCHSASTHGHSIAITDFRLRDSGFERMLVLAPADTSETRAGRISARLLELETYRMMALRGLPVAKELGPMLTESESVLSTITARLEGKHDGDQDLLDTLVSLAARVERAAAEHVYRFSATQAYNVLVLNRIAELR